MKNCIDRWKIKVIIIIFKFFKQLKLHFKNPVALLFLWLFYGI